MQPSVRSIVEAFDLLYKSIHDRKFRKTLELNQWGERDLLPLVRTFLLGYFGRMVQPEVQGKLPGTLSGSGLIDFMIGRTAIEFAVRKPLAPKAALSTIVNDREIKKLMKHDGHAVLVLFDFSKSPYSSEQLERFREWPSLGKGNHKKSPFSVAYFYISSMRPEMSYNSIIKNIRVG